MSYTLNRFNLFDSDVLPFTFNVEDGEIRSQSHSREYYWLGPYLTQNTQGLYIPLLPVEVDMLTPPGLVLDQ